ncbi:hypothetical protein Tsubulata_017349 [Turnera subulata]|uniref:DUF4283 domain-containing protein n=1 Tax=Turnera subulata TaxID=218843 RepID=A0A9Q0GEV5_9ROSI|nr:hypothetical protein Tsubulata_017349 [Turnera subulata]
MSGRFHTPTLQLTEAEQGAVVLDEENSMEEPHEAQLSLVGKLWTNRSFNTQAFMRTMKMVWKPVYDLEISQLDSNLFVFQFYHWRDRERVLENEPWNFDNQLVILSEISGNEQPSEIRLDHSPMWVRVYDVPFNLQKLKFVELLGEKVGSFLELNAECSLTKESSLGSRPLSMSPGLYYVGLLRKKVMGISPSSSAVLHNSGAPVTKVKRKLVFKPAGKDIGQQTGPNDDLSPGGLTDETPTARAEMVHPKHVPNATPEKTWVREEGSVRDNPLDSTVAKDQRIGRTEREDLELDATNLPTDLHVMPIPELQCPISLLSGSLASTILSSPIQLSRPLVEMQIPGLGGVGNVPIAIPPVPPLCVTQSGHNVAGPSLSNTKWKRLARLAPVGSGLVVDQGGSAKRKNPRASDGDLSDENGPTFKRREVDLEQIVLDVTGSAEAAKQPRQHQ